MLDQIRHDRFRLEQRADRDQLLSEAQHWIYNGSNGVPYYAPHPALQIVSSDLDGHQMAQVRNGFETGSLSATLLL